MNFSYIFSLTKFSKYQKNKTQSYNYRTHNSASFRIKKINPYLELHMPVAAIPF